MKRAGKAKVHGGVATTGVMRDLSLFVVVATLAAVHAWAHVEGTLAGYRLSSAQHEQHELVREGQALRLELATRRSAQRIEFDARERLGMVEPSPDRIISIGHKKGGKVASALAAPEAVALSGVAP